MGYKLAKPYTQEQRNNFLSKYHRQMGLRTQETSKYLFALEANEIIADGEIVINENYEQEKAEEELQNIYKLTMTALDFINFLENCNITLEEINTYLDSNLRIKMQLLYCQNVYCGVVCKLLPIEIKTQNGIISITEDMIKEAFINKNNYTANSLFF